ncbi:MAG: carotenoid oxygenase family protein [Pirellula sp.]
MDLRRRDFLVRTAVAMAALQHPGRLSWGAIEQDAAPIETGNRFLQGNFAPVLEEVHAEGLPVEGEIPRGLEGMLVRNGPNPRFSPLGKYHWFDGDGMLHGVHIADGKASYQNRFIETEGYRKELKAGKALHTGLLEMPDLKLVLAGRNPFKNPANTSVVFHANRLLALWEAGEPYRIEPRGLKTAGIESFDGKLKHPFTAHPKIDPRTGEMLTFGYVPSEPVLVMSQIDASGAWVRSTRIPIGKPTMVHDFAITERYAIFPLCPLYFDVKRLLQGTTPWYFDQSQPTRFAVVSRDDPSQVRMLEGESCFVFHLLNAFETGGEDATQIELVGCRYEQFPGSLNFGDADDANASDTAIPYRWVLDLKNGTVRSEALQDEAAEFPRLNDAYVGRKHRYGYVGLGDEEFFHGFRKLDLERGHPSDIHMPDGWHCGEGIFVASGSGDSGAKGLDASREDNGWLLAFMHHATLPKCELGIWDAQSFDSKPVARIRLPQRVPYGFHGTWVPGWGMG